MIAVWSARSGKWRSMQLTETFSTPSAYHRTRKSSLWKETSFTEVKDVSFHKEDFRVRWYADGVLNVSVNCIDRHLPERADQTAIIWESDDGSISDRISYG